MIPFPKLISSNYVDMLLDSSNNFISVKFFWSSSGSTFFMKKFSAKGFIIFEILKISWVKI